MGNKSIWIAGALMMFIGLLFASRVNEKNYPTRRAITPSAALSVATGIPLQQETDILHRFFSLVDEKKIVEAVGMTNDGQEWVAQLNAMDSVKILSIDTSLLGDWTTQRHTYKVTLEMRMNASSANSPIPYYGYKNGVNIRFISLVKSGTIWKIESIATGP